MSCLSITKNLYKNFSRYVHSQLAVNFINNKKFVYFSEKRTISTQKKLTTVNKTPQTQLISIKIKKERFIIDNFKFKNNPFWEKTKNEKAKKKKKASASKNAHD